MVPKPWSFLSHREDCRFQSGLSLGFKASGLGGGGWVVPEKTKDKEVFDQH